MVRLFQTFKLYLNLKPVRASQSFLDIAFEPVTYPKQTHSYRGGTNIHLSSDFAGVTALTVAHFNQAPRNDRQSCNGVMQCPQHQSLVAGDIR